MREDKGKGKGTNVCMDISIFHNQVKKMKYN